MSPITVFAFYFIIWWLTFFAILPFGVRTQDENDDVTLGTVSSAPSKPMLLRKALATTIVSAIILGIIYWAVAIQGLTLDDIPFMPDMSLT
ncbi:MAG: DUF1467 family protein [Pseudomonadota bacterium]